MDQATVTRNRLRVVVALLVLLTLVGMFWLRPQSDALPEVEELEPYAKGDVRSVESLGVDEEAAELGMPSEDLLITVEITSGDHDGEIVGITQDSTGMEALEPGIGVLLFEGTQPGCVEGQECEPQFFVADFQRGGSLLLLLGLFIGAVLLVSRWHGVRSLVGLGLSLLVVVGFVVPAILSGQPPGMVALVGALAVMLITLYLAHGVNLQTTSAVVGTTVALATTVLLGTWFIDQTSLTGLVSEDAQLLSFNVEGGLDLRGLVLAGLIIGALGVLDDVTVSQASTVFTLHDTDPQMHSSALFRSAMQVGRDHIAATVNTLFLAYAGASLALLGLFSTGGQPISEIISSETVAEELVKTLVGSLGLILAVPATTLLAAVVATRRSRGEILSSRARHRADPHPHD